MSLCVCVMYDFHEFYDYFCRNDIYDVKKYDNAKVIAFGENVFYCGDPVISSRNNKIKKSWHMLLFELIAAQQ